MFRLGSCVRYRRAVVPVARWYCEQVRVGRRVTGSYRSAPRLMNEFNSYLAFISDRRSETMPSNVYQFLKACGTRMVYETPETRTTLAKDIWAQLKKTGLQMDVGIYNILLQVYLLNEHTFSPSEFVEEMKDSEVDPNQGTLALLLQGYCHQGNMAGATKMLEQMRSLEVPINEHVYAALVTGHSRSGDVKTAGELLGVMRENGLSPGIVAYSALLCAHAERGNIDAIKTVMSEMRENRVFPSVPVYIKMMDALSRSGHGQLVSQILEMVRNKQWMVADIRDLVCQFAVRGEIESAMILIQCVTELRAHGGAHGMTFGPVMVRAMLAKERPVTEVLELIHQLNEMDCGDHGHEELLHGLLKSGSHGDVYTVLREMHSLGLHPHTQYLYPVLAQCAEKEDKDGILECVRVMLELGLDTDNKVWYYWEQAQGKGGVETMLDPLQASGLMGALVNEVIKYLCIYKHLEPIPGLIKSAGSEKLKIGMILNSIVSSVVSGGHDVDGLANIYAALHSLSPTPPLSNHVGTVIDHLVNQGHTPLASAFLDKLYGLGVRVEGTPYGKLLAAHCHPSRAHDFFAVLKSMTAHDVPLRAQHHRQILGMSAALGDSGKARESLAKLKLPDRISCSSYIIAHAKDGKLQLAVEMLETLRRRDECPTFEAFYHLISVILHLGNLEGGLAMRDEMHSCGYHSRYAIHCLFIEAYAQRGDVTGAKKEFDDMLSKDISPSTDTYAALMSAYSFHGSAEPVRELLKGMAAHQVTLTRGMVSALLEAYINSGDLEGALSVVHEFPEHPPLLTSLLTLLGALVARQEGDGVKRVTDAIQNRVGLNGNQVDNILLFTYLRAGQVEHAREVITKEGFNVDWRKLVSFSRSESMQGKVESVKQAIELVRSLGDSRVTDNLSIALLRAYGRVKDTAGALQLKQNLEEFRGQKLSKEFYSVLTESIFQQSNEAPFIASTDAAVASP